MSKTNQEKLRTFLNERGWDCMYCGRECIVTGDMKDPAHATREHIMPKSRGGKAMGVSCVTCNGIKGDMTEAEYRFFLETHTLADTYVEWITQLKIRSLRELGLSSNGKASGTKELREHSPPAPVTNGSG